MYKMTASVRPSRAGSGACAPSPRGAEGRRAAGGGAGQQTGVRAPEPGRDWACAPSPRRAEGRRSAGAGRPASVRSPERGGGGLFKGKEASTP